MKTAKPGAAQPFDQVKSAIRNVLLRKKVQETMDELRKTAKIEVLDEDLKKYAADVEKKRRAMVEQQEWRCGPAASRRRG